MFQVLGPCFFFMPCIKKKVATERDPPRLAACSSCLLTDADRMPTGFPGGTRGISAAFFFVANGDKKKG